MKNRASNGAGSLDMLLDTMCNTFGGVCFIALLVAIISATLPPDTKNEDDPECVSEQMIIDKETSRLIRERDSLKAAIDIQKSFLEANKDSGDNSHSVEQLAASVSSNSTSIANLQREKAELENALASLESDMVYSKREANRLARLLKELDERLGKPANTKNRIVRTPVERELSGYVPLTVWLSKGKLYCLDNPRHVEEKSYKGASGYEWDYRIKPLSGWTFGDSLFQSPEYRQMIAKVAGKTFLRIFCDAASFPQLCELRDDLIRNRKLYNWYWFEDQTLHFVEGNDGKVQ